MFDGIYINIIKDGMHGNDVQETLPSCFPNCQQVSSKGKGAKRQYSTFRNRPLGVKLG